MKKLTYMNIKGQKLTREEMRNVMAGSGGSGGECDLYCGNGCTLACGVPPCRVENGALECGDGNLYTCEHSECRSQ